MKKEESQAQNSLRVAYIATKEMDEILQQAATDAGI